MRRARPRWADIPRAAAALARDLRVPRRTRSGSRLAPWPQIADQVAAAGLGRHDPYELGRAANNLPADEHPLAGPTADERAQLEQGWRKGWAEMFPGEAWPGLAEAQRRIRGRALNP